MGLGLAGIGSFAGGLASGIQQGQRMHHDMDRQKRAKEEDERKKGLRLAGANTFGNVGTDREDGSTYGEADAAQDYLKQSAPYDDNPLGTRAAASHLKASGLQVKGLERQENEAQLGEQSMALMRELQSGGDPMGVYRKAMQLYGKVPDGKHASLAEDPAGNLMMVLTDTNTGQSRLAQFSPENVQKALTGLHALTSPKAFNQERELGLKERGVSQKDRELGLKERDIASQEGLRGSMGRAYDALAGQRDQTSSVKMPEADRVMLTGIGDRLKSLDVLMSKVDPNDPASVQQLGQLKQQQRTLLSQQYAIQKKHGLVPPGMTLSAFRGLPDPMQMVMTAINAANTESEFLQSMRQIEQLYSDDPEAADALNAMEDVRRDKFSRVKSQTVSMEGGPAMRLVPQGMVNAMVGGANTMAAQGMPISASGIGGMPMYGAQQQQQMGLAQQQQKPRGQEVKGLIRR